MSWSTAQVAEVYKGRGVPCPVQAACGDGRKPHKYHAQPVMIDGHRFDSSLEARHYFSLKIAQEQGWITDLELQPRFILQPKLKLPSGATQRAITYVADFRFKQDGRDVVVDVKAATHRIKLANGRSFDPLGPMFRIKQKLLKVKYPEIDLQIWGKEKQ